MTEDVLQELEQLNEFALSADERRTVLAVFEEMRTHETAMQALDTANVEIMVHVRPMVNVLRDDVRQQPFAREDLLAGGPEHTEDSWQVPRLVK